MAKLKYNHHIVKKKFGQNFLIDNDIINSIVYSINPKNTETMIEIGPGLGALTKHMYKYLNKLFLVEYDIDLVNRLLNYFSDVKNLKIFFKNALKFDFSHIDNKYYNSVRVFGNLPYNISVLLLLHLFKYKNIYDMHFMFQKEVANRLLAFPNTKHYGRLSIISQYFCNITHLFDVFPESFRPIPKVSSTFLRLSPYQKKKYYLKNLKSLIKVTSLAFGNRRKIIKNSLFELFSENELINLQIDPTLRAENISIEQYCRLSNCISE
ncbi:16S rRNA methyltransferase [Buchnera aphidicola (Schlechtendalia chinensis)]|uniref:Ribosomal RNA small subunit methyltransferase A n=1 Tax=Buchnera aphidicola subsp. Schlechtendalia chinensis TaxID=118110 RepID=A0A172WD98_BUCSC|nr:16S rRNA (adenine(1518)-N(6)/adenine(1519)-N(6))-dimethyltransferase RsmA [Buchnera aphidicola]ANF16940.1 16S rRNA methyltransferase [Buchnera aphidicola (Schlechtendalia chinensis)]